MWNYPMQTWFKDYKAYGPKIYQSRWTAEMADHLSVLEAAGEASGTPTEALAVPIQMFEDHNVQVR